VKRINGGDKMIDGKIVIIVILYLGSAFIFFVRTAAMGGTAARVQEKVHVFEQKFHKSKGCIDYKINER
jgi:hypothetical protein